MAASSALSCSSDTCTYSLSGLGGVELCLALSSCEVVGCRKAGLSPDACMSPPLAADAARGFRTICTASRPLTDTPTYSTGTSLTWEQNSWTGIQEVLPNLTQPDTWIAAHRLHVHSNTTTPPRRPHTHIRPSAKANVSSAEQTHPSRHITHCCTLHNNMIRNNAHGEATPSLSRT